MLRKCKCKDRLCWNMLTVQSPSLEISEDTLDECVIKSKLGMLHPVSEISFSLDLCDFYLVMQMSEIST